MDLSECSDPHPPKRLQNCALLALDSKLLDRVLAFLDAATLLELRLANKSNRKTIESLKVWCEKLVHSFLPDPCSLLGPEDGPQASSNRDPGAGQPSILELRNKTSPIWFRYFISLLAISRKPHAPDELGSLMTAVPRELLKTIHSSFG